MWLLWYYTCTASTIYLPKPCTPCSPLRRARHRHPTCAGPRVGHTRVTTNLGTGSHRQSFRAPEIVSSWVAGRLNRARGTCPQHRLPGRTPSSACCFDIPAQLVNLAGWSDDHFPLLRHEPRNSLWPLRPKLRGLRGAGCHVLLSARMVTALREEERADCPVGLLPLCFYFRRVDDVLRCARHRHAMYVCDRRDHARAGLSS